MEQPSIIQLVDKFRSLDPVISELLAVSGSPALSIGVLHHGKVVYTNHRGNRDISKPGIPNDETLYHVMSLTKVLAASAISILVEQGRLHWDSHIRDILPEFKLRNDIVGYEATLVDVLSNRTGLAVADPFFGHRCEEIAIAKSESTRMACSIQAIRPFRQSFIYSSWNYALVTNVIEQVTGQTFGTFAKEMILDPLNMRRTTIKKLDATDSNIAMTHAVFNDGTACKIPFPAYSDEETTSAGFAAKSTMNDLLVMYKSLISSYNDQKQSGSTSTPGSPFKHLQTVFSPHIKTRKSSSDTQAYCMGIYKTELPGNVGVASINDAYLGSQNKPFPGISKPGLEVFHHTGNVPGGLASMFLIPSSETAIVVLTNSFSLCDPTDFVGRLILSVILNEARPTNFVGLSKLVRQISIGSYAKLAASLEAGKTTRAPSKALAAYEGDYFNGLGNYFLRVQTQPGGLLLIVQGLKYSRYNLLPYDEDTFYWPADREQELCVEHRAPWVWPGFHKVVFIVNNSGVVDKLTWELDPRAKPEVFKKSEGKGNEARL